MNNDGDVPKEITRRPLVGMGVLVMRQGMVLLGKRLGSHGAGYFAAPGGHIEFGESFEHAARREVREETGLEIENLRLLTVGNYLFSRTNGDRHYIDVDFACESPAGEVILKEPDKCEGWQWYELDQLPEPLFIVTKRMIESLEAETIPVNTIVVERQ